MDTDEDWKPGNFDLDGDFDIAQYDGEAAERASADSAL